MRHAVEHATSDLAGTVKIPGFRAGKVPPQVLKTRIGHDRLMTEAVESHIGGWFWNAAASTRIRPIAQPEFDYDLPASEDDAFSFTATVEVTVKEIKEKVLPPADDELARAASEFETLEALRGDIEAVLRDQLEEELDAAFRAEAVDRLVDASGASAAGPLVDTRARELL